MPGLAIFLALLFGAFFVTAVIVVHVDEAKDAVVIAILGLVAIGAATVAWTLYRSLIRWDDTGIAGESAWQGLRQCPWSEIAAVRYAPIWGAFVIVAADGTQLRIPLHYTGIATFVDHLEQKLPSSRYKDAQAGIERIRAGKL